MSSNILYILSRNVRLNYFPCWPSKTGFPSTHIHSNLSTVCRYSNCSLYFIWFPYKSTHIKDAWYINPEISEMLLKGTKRHCKEGKIDKLDNEVKRGLLVTVNEHRFDHPVPSWPKLSSIVWYKNNYFSEERIWGEGLIGLRRTKA